MYFLFCDDQDGKKQLWRFNTKEELKDHIKVESSNNEETLIDELGEMIVVEGREIGVCLNELQYIKKLELEYKDQL